MVDAIQHGAVVETFANNVHAIVGVEKTLFGFALRTHRDGVFSDNLEALPNF